MRIRESQPSINTAAKCSKMSEDRRHGIQPDEGNPAAGGRLKFFKDGKFILELERTREGERMSWVSVPRKTFWPPQGNVSSTPTYRQESSTSLSVSDDNSSVQSSPWQRDHSWKQSLPRKNQSQEMCFFFYRCHKKRVLNSLRSHKTRKPYSKSPERNSSTDVNNDSSNRTKLCNNVNVNSNSTSDDNKQQKHNIVTQKSNGKSAMRSLMKIVDILAEKCANAAPTELVNKSLIQSRAEQVVSPRKRILRELEKVTIEDTSSSHKRCRNKPQQQQQLHPPHPHHPAAAPSLHSSHHHHHHHLHHSPLSNAAKTTAATSSSPGGTSNSPVRMNGSASPAAIAAAKSEDGASGAVSRPQATTAATTSSASSSVATTIKTETASSKNNCSYSINSLLGGGAGDKRRESPPQQHHQQQQQQHVQAPSHYGRDAADLWSSYPGDVERLRNASLDLPQVPDKRVLPSYHPHAPTYSYVPPYHMYPPYHLSPYYYGRGPYMMPHVYPPPPLQPLLRHHEPPSCSWTPAPSTTNADSNIKEEPRSLSSSSTTRRTTSAQPYEYVGIKEERNDNDMPLNLSKHGG